MVLAQYIKYLRPRAHIQENEENNVKNHLLFHCLGLFDFLEDTFISGLELDWLSSYYIPHWLANDEIKNAINPYIIEKHDEILTKCQRLKKINQLFE